MSKLEFTHLHLHTEFSILDGACRIEALMQRAKELNFDSLAITDHGVMFGAIEFYQAARKYNIKPIIGCEVYVARGNRREKKSRVGGKRIYNHLVLLAHNEIGYRNLVQLVSDAHLEGYYYKPRTDKETLEKHSEGLVVLSGCIASEIPELIVHNKLAEAKEAMDWFRQVFGKDHFFLELQNHGIAEQAIVNRHLIQWASEFDLKLVATNDVHYVEKSHSHAHDSLICIGTQSLLSDKKRMRYQPEQFYLRSAEEMASLFHEVPESIRNTRQVAEMCDLEIAFGKLRYPIFDPPPPFSREGYLTHLLAEGLGRRYGIEAQSKEESITVGKVPQPDRLPTYEKHKKQITNHHVHEKDSENFENSKFSKDSKDFGNSKDSKDFENFENSENAKDSENSDSAFARIVDLPTRRATKDVMDRIHFEMEIIKKTGFVSYFLIVGDFVRHGRSKGIACVARGSAAGSIVTFLLGISNVDPLRYGLLFERFLNPERISPPDIDIDFADDRRADVIQYTRKKYGSECVAQIITFGTMGAKSVIRDVGRVMGLDYSKCDHLAKMVPNELKMSLHKALAQSPNLKAAYENEKETKSLFDTAFVLEDCARNASVHAAGVVIGSEPLSQLLPLKEDDNGGRVTQYAMGPVGDLGLLKMDFLGLRTLTVIRNACERIEQTKGIQLDIEKINLSDSKSYDLMNRGNTIGIFQLESGGMRDLCRRFQLSSVEHITALISLYRPGPMDLIPNFIARRHGEVPITYAHPLLKAISEETYGILIYQEQVMQAAQRLAGYTLGSADLLRRAMSKKKVDEMRMQRQTFVEGCQEKNGISAKKANTIFDLLEKFAGYGFNKSHAVAYALLAYQTAYLKANYPVEFLSAMMTSEMNDTDKLAILIDEAKALGVDVLPPDINESQVVFAPAPKGRGIRFGMAAIKGVGEAAVKAILNARKDGYFESLLDLCGRVNLLKRKVLEALIRSGSCDSFGSSRATLMDGIEQTISRASSLASDKASGQTSMFDVIEQQDDRQDDLKKIPEWSLEKRLEDEKELLGFYISGHPLEPYQCILDRYCLDDSSTMKKRDERALTRIGGLIVAVQSGTSKKSGKPYAMLTIEDRAGAFQVLCSGENLLRDKSLFEKNQPVMIAGEINAEDKVKIFAQEIVRLEEAPKRWTAQVHIRLQHDLLSAKMLSEIRDLTEKHSGKCPLFLCIQMGQKSVFIEAHEQFSVLPGLAIEKAAASLLGKEAYHIRTKKLLRHRDRRSREK